MSPSSLRTANKIERLDVVPRIALWSENHAQHDSTFERVCECGSHLRKHLHYDGHVFPSVAGVVAKSSPDAPVLVA